MLTALPPYALSAPSFRFRALATLAGRAPLGGAREVAMACFLIARLAQDALPDRALPVALRAARAAQAKGWLAALSLPAALRIPMARLVDATGTDDPPRTAALLDAVLEQAGTHLDGPARAELGQLARHWAT